MIDKLDTRLNYSNQQLLFDCKRKQYNRQIFNKRTELRILKAEKISNTFNLINFKTCKLKEFKNTIKIKNSLNKAVLEKYKDNLFRKLKWYCYINRQKAETKLVKSIRKTFGDEKEPVLIIGDWSSKVQLRNFMPTPGIGLKRRLARDFKIFHIDEFRTSKLHWRTGEKCEKLMIEKENGKKKKIHAVLRAKLENGCYGCINRDLNSCRNMREIVKKLMEKGKRPKKFKRGL